MADQHLEDEAQAIVQWLTSAEHQVPRETALAMRNGIGYTWDDVAVCSGDLSLLLQNHPDWPQGTLRALLFHAIDLTSARRAATFGSGESKEHLDALAPLVRLRACDVYFPCTRRAADYNHDSSGGSYADGVMDDSLSGLTFGNGGGGQTTTLTLSQVVATGAMRGKRAVCLRGANLLSITALASSLDDEVILVDLRLNRLSLACSGSNMRDDVRRLLQVETRHVMIAGNPMASALDGGAEFFATLSPSELERLHWVPENWIGAGIWKVCLSSRGVQFVQRLETAYRAFYFVLGELVKRGVWPIDE